VHGGLHITDVTNASRTQLMNLDTLDWDGDLLAAFEIPRAMLPAIRSSSERYGSASVEPIEGVPITASSAISRQHWSARHASAVARRRIPTAPAASCY
jgi:glycerol kinase